MIPSLPPNNVSPPPCLSQGKSQFRNWQRNWFVWPRSTKNGLLLPCVCVAMWGEACIFVLLPPRPPPPAPRTTGLKPHGREVKVAAWSTLLAIQSGLFWVLVAARLQIVLKNCLLCEGPHWLPDMGWVGDAWMLPSWEITGWLGDSNLDLGSRIRYQGRGDFLLSLSL